MSTKKNSDRKTKRLEAKIARLQLQLEAKGDTKSERRAQRAERWAERVQWIRNRKPFNLGCLRWLEQRQRNKAKGIIEENVEESGAPGSEFGPDAAAA